MSPHIETLSPAREALWDSFVDQHPNSTCYHHRAWQTAARQAYGIETPSLIALGDAGEIQGALPLFLIDNLLFRYAVTGIFGAYGQVLTASNDIRFALLSEASRIALARRTRHLLHKTLGEEPLASGWTTRQAAVTATLSLLGGPDALWKGFRGEIRNRVRKAEKSGLEVHVGRALLPDFYEVLAANMHRKGTPIYGLPFISSLLDGFKDRACIMTLRLKSETVAGALLVEHRGVVNVPFISSLQSAVAIAPNNLLYWEIIKRSCERGQRVLDFGRSFLNSSNLDFKIRWGAEVIPQPFHFVHRGAPPRMDPGDAVVMKVVELWKRLPRGVADRLGPFICGRFLV